MSEESPPFTDYFKSVPLWSKDAGTKRFEVMADGLSGRIPVTRVESWKDFQDLLDDSFFNRPRVHLVYRGHRRYDWDLTPTLGRLSVNGIITEALASTQLLKFRKAIRGRTQDRGLLENDEEQWQNDERWAVGQHHGLMTPLLDWTYSPFVGLFFAFAKSDNTGAEKDNPYRVVYVLNKTFVKDDGQCPDIRIIEPRKDDHGRLVNQAGLFTFSPTDATIENKLLDILSDPEFEDDELRNASEEDQPDILAKYICKIYIRNEDREGCLKHLRRMNVHHASLFPDLIGASEYCNLLTEEEEKESKLERHRKQEEAKGKLVNVKMSVEVPVTVSINAEVIRRSGFAGILREPESAAQIEPGRISAMVEELEKAFQKERVVDWTHREPALARMRLSAKSILRKYGYPISDREEVIPKLIKEAIKRENKGEGPEEDSK